MAARLRKTHQDEIRTKIKVSQLLNVLHKQALDPDSVEISSVRMKAIELLLKKALPDLSAVEHSGGIEHEHSFASVLNAIK